MRKSVLHLIIMLLATGTPLACQGQGVYNPVLPGAYGGYGTFYGGFGPFYSGARARYFGKYNTSRAAHNYQRWRNQHRNPYLDTVPRYTHEDYCNEIYNYLQRREFDRNLERFMRR